MLVKTAFGMVNLNWFENTFTFNIATISGNQFKNNWSLTLAKFYNILFG